MCTVFLYRCIFTDINVTGTSSGAEGSVVVDLECSAECEDITATGTDLRSPNGTATYICENIATVSEVGVVFHVPLFSSRVISDCGRQLDFNCTAPSS